MRVRRICAVPNRIVASPAWIERHGRPASPAELRPGSVFGYLYSRTPNRLVFRHRLTGEEVAIATEGRLRVNNGEAMMPALEAGLGVSMLPEFLVWDELGRGTLVALLEDWRPMEAGLNVVTPPGDPRPARVALVIDFLVERLARAPWARQEPDAAPSGRP